MTDFPKFQQYLSTVFIWKLVFTAWESESNTLIHQQQCSKNKTILKMLHFKTFDNFKFLFFFISRWIFFFFFCFKEGEPTWYEILTQFESSNKTTIRFLSHTHTHMKSICTLLLSPKLGIILNSSTIVWIVNHSKTVSCSHGIHTKMTTAWVLVLEQQHKPTISTANPYMIIQSWFHAKLTLI